jgi:hypothetical protein
MLSMMLESDAFISSPMETPPFAFVILAFISWLVSLAASALLVARFFTSPATTANPFPWTPARAASTDALSASIFVWKAISSMTFMMFEMPEEAWFISSRAIKSASFYIALDCLGIDFYRQLFCGRGASEFFLSDH